MPKFSRVAAASEYPHTTNGNPIQRRADGKPQPIRRDFGGFEQAYCGAGVRPADAVWPWALEHLLEVLSPGRYQVLSLDVFDTLLLRSVKAEKRRFWEIAEQWRELLRAGDRPSVSVEDLFRARRRAAEICYSYGPLVAETQEGRLDNIVEIVLTLLNLPRLFAEPFIEAEIAYEAEETALNPLVVELVRAQREAGGRVILLSDMYMRAVEIDALLARHDAEWVSDQTFSSADLSMNKRTGTVFNEIAGRLGVGGAEILHIGDSYTSDFFMPRLVGWSAQHLPIPLEEELFRQADLREFNTSRGEG